MSEIARCLYRSGSGTRIVTPIVHIIRKEQRMKRLT